MSAILEPPRRASTSDSVRLAAIHAAAFVPSEAWSSEVFGLQLALPNVIGLVWREQALILVRVAGGEIAGGEGEILTLAVAPPARRRGIGRLLLGEALIRLAAASARVVFLEVALKNTAALALYTSFEFTAVGRRPRYYSDGSDALVLRLALKPSP